MAYWMYRDTVAILLLSTVACGPTVGDAGEATEGGSDGASASSTGGEGHRSIPANPATGGSGGPDTSATSVSEGGPDSAGSATVATASSGLPTESASGTVGDASDSATTTSTTSGSSDTTLATGASMSDGGTDGEGITHTAAAIPGGLDRVRIAVADPATGLCAVLNLVRDGFSNLPGVAVPSPWALEAGLGHDDPTPEGCGPHTGVGGNAVFATQGLGSVDWGMEDLSGGGMPCWLDLDLTVEFPDTGDAWLPTHYRVRADRVRVDGTICN